MISLAKIMDEALPLIANGTAPRILQDDRLATWAAKRTPADGVVNWSLPAVEIQTLIRAVGRPYAGASSFNGPARLTLWSADVVGGSNKHLLRSAKS